jgi:hypothetical protein
MSEASGHQVDIGAANESVDNKGVGNKSVGSSDISGHEPAMSRKDLTVIFAESNPAINPPIPSSILDRRHRFWT